MRSIGPANLILIFSFRW